MKERLPLLASAFLLLAGCVNHASVSTALPTHRTTGLPYVDGFEPERYLGKWYEIARLPTPIQPAETLATAEYAAGTEEGTVTVRNTSYNAKGDVLASIEGNARIATGWSPGSLLVAFGPSLPETPNYQVIYLDRDYRYAVVGSPSRQAMWILSREAVVSQDKLAELTRAGSDAGFDVSQLIISPWDQVPNLP